MSHAEKPNHTLDNDGISETLFDLLWTKDELNFGPSINIPDTIIYRNGQPASWYFTSSNGKIKRKSRQNLVLAKIEQSFLKRSLGYDVIASFVSVEALRTDDDEKKDAYNNSSPSVVQYFDQKRFHEFLYDHSKTSFGILQRFIEPKGTKNEIIRAIWSPKICLLERYENVHQLHDHRFGLYERCITYEGPEYYAVSSPVRGPVLAGQIQRICELIVSHIAEITFGQITISRIALSFKVDSREKLWFLHSTSIRTLTGNNNTSSTLFHRQSSTNSILNKTLINIDSTVSLPSNVVLNTHKSYSMLDEEGMIQNELLIRDQQIQCLSCGTQTLENTRHPITYKSIIKHYEHVLQLSSFDPYMNSKSNAAFPTSPSSSAHTLSRAGNMSTPGMPATIRWPPDPEILEAAGGVGFGCLDAIIITKSPKSRAKSPDARNENAMAIYIPPIIRCLHPKLNWKSYSKCRNDPLFLYKTVNVCETCFLVYAEFMTMLLRLDGDLTSLLGPEPSTTNSAGLHSRGGESSVFGTGAAGSAESRPKSADWRAISAMHRSRSRGKSRSAEGGDSSSSYGASASAEGFHSMKRPPVVPQPIRRQEDVSQMARSSGLNESSTRSGYGGGGGGGWQDRYAGGTTGLEQSQQQPSKYSLYDPEEIRMMIAEREKHFFREIAKNPQLREQHPLMHLITTQQKLLIAEQQGGIVVTQNPSLTSKSTKLFSSKYGESQVNSKPSNNSRFQSYREEVKINTDNLITEHPSKTSISHGKSISDSKKSISGGGSKLKTSSITSSVSESSKAHIEYLKSVMARLEDESQPLKPSSKSKTTKDSSKTKMGQEKSLVDSTTVESLLEGHVDDGNDEPIDP